MNPLVVSEPREVKFSESENFAPQVMILHQRKIIHSKTLDIPDPHLRIQNQHLSTAHQEPVDQGKVDHSTIDLLHNLGSSHFRIMLRDSSAKYVVVHIVFARELVG